MTDHFIHEDEEAEKVKRWLRENGMSLVVGVALGLAAILGWQWWNAHQRSTAEQGSLAYQRLLQAVQSQDLETARSRGDTLFEDFEGSPYATLGALMLSKLAVEQDDLDSAAQYLAWAIEHANQEETRHIARLRLVRVQLARGRVQEAETVLEQVDHPSFQAEVQELKGDVYLAMKRPDQAREAYRAARAALEPGAPAALLEIKLANLAVAPE